MKSISCVQLRFDGGKADEQQRRKKKCTNWLDSLAGDSKDLSKCNNFGGKGSNHNLFIIDDDKQAKIQKEYERKLAESQMVEERLTANKLQLILY